MDLSPAPGSFWQSCVLRFKRTQCSIMEAFCELLTASGLRRNAGRPELDTFDFPAIHPDGCAGQPLRSRRDQKRHQVGNLLRFTVATNARLLRELFDRFLEAHPMFRGPSLHE